MVETIAGLTTVISEHEWRVADLDGLPEGYRYEIFDGVLYMSPMPELPHAVVIANLSDILSPWVRARKLGRVLHPQTGVYLNEKNYVDPDLVFLAPGQYQAGAKRAIAARLVVEVLSPANRRVAREEREQRFGEAQVEEIWYVDEEQRTLEVRRQAEDGYGTVALFQGEDVVSSAVLPGLEFPLTALWEDLDA